jgi:hypothetical protein
MKTDRSSPSGARRVPSTGREFSVGKGVNRKGETGFPDADTGAFFCSEEPVVVVGAARFVK